MQNSIRTESYWTARADFDQLHHLHRNYADLYLNHEIFPHEKYLAQKEMLEEQWAKHPVSGGGRSLDKDVEQLFTRYRNIQHQHENDMSLINLLFSRIYGYYYEMLNDYERSHLPATKFIQYLQQYHETIQKNKELRLDSWVNPVADQIQMKIEDLLKKN